MSDPIREAAQQHVTEFTATYPDGRRVCDLCSNFEDSWPTPGCATCALRAALAAPEPQDVEGAAVPEPPEPIEDGWRRDGEGVSRGEQVAYWQYTNGHYSRELPIPLAVEAAIRADERRRLAQPEEVPDAE